MAPQQKEKQSSFLRLSSEAQSFLHHGKKEEALACYDAFLKEFPNDSRALYGKGMIYYEFQDYAAALQYFDKALALNANDLDSLYAKGVVLHSQGQAQEAIAVFDSILQHQDNFSLAWLGKGCALLTVKKAEEALQCFERVEKLSPQLDVSASKGHAFRILKKYREARKSYSDALAKDPYDAEALFGLGAMAYASKDWKRATELLYRCVVQDEEHLHAWELLVEIYRQTKQEEKERVALKHLAKLRGTVNQ